MVSIRSFFAILITFGVFLVVASAASSARGVRDAARGQDLKNLVSGTRLTHVSPRSGNQVQLNFRADGKLRIVRRGGRELQGRWYIRGGRLMCLELSIFRRGKACMLFVRNGNSIVRYKRNGKKVKGADYKIVIFGPRARNAGYSKAAAGASAKVGKRRRGEEPDASKVPRNAMTGTALRQALSGRTVSLKTRRGGATTFTFARNGSVAARLSTGRVRQDSGRWSIRKNKFLCLKFAKIGRKKRFCRALVRRGNTFLLYRGRDGRRLNRAVWTLQ